MNLFYRGYTQEQLEKSIMGYAKKLSIYDNVVKALQLTNNLHAAQTRRDGPYIMHLLRVTQRLIDPFQIVADQDIIIAALLHDSVEDQVERFPLVSGNMYHNRENALAYIATEFGLHVKHIISHLTNPEFDEKLSQEETWEQYREHVTKAIQSPNVFYIKLSDFIDNATQLHLVDDEKRTRLQQKYGPLYPIFIQRLRKNDIYMLDTVKETITNVLEEAQATPYVSDL